MKSKQFFSTFSLLGIFAFTSVFTGSGSGIVNDDIRYHGVEINGFNSLYVTGVLTYYVDKDKRLNATIYFYTIFDEVIARAYMDVTLKENDTQVTFEAPIHIDNASDPLEVKSTHHIRWKINAIERIDCCVNHAGIIGCDEDSGKIECYDGEISPNCTCDEYNIFE